MLRGPFALVLRYILLLAGSALATAGIITAAGPDLYCFSPKVVADAATTGLIMLLGGGASVAGSIAWRAWAKVRGGVT